MFIILFCIKLSTIIVELDKLSSTYIREKVIKYVHINVNFVELLKIRSEENLEKAFLVP